MIKKINYVMIDTSQIIDLIKDGRTSFLSTPDFYEQYGLPFISIHQIFELGKCDSFYKFQNDLSCLSQVYPLFTVSPFGGLIPFHIADLFYWELSCLLKGPITINELKNQFDSMIKPFFITQNPIEIRLIYDYAQKSSQSSGIVSVLNPIEFNKYAKFKARELEKIDYTDEEASKLSQIGKESMAKYIEERVKSISQKASLISGINNTPDNTWELIKPFKNMEDAWQNILGNDFNPEETLDKLFLRFEFREIKKVYSKHFSIPFSDIQDIKIEDTILFRFKQTNRMIFHKDLYDDANRKIETGNETDLDLLTLSFFMNVFVDKRILDFTNKHLKDFEFRSNIFKSLRI
jgi:hypothetical protein